MHEIHLKQPGFTYSACGPFTKNKERIQKFKVTGDLRYIYQNELDKACFQHDMAYGDFKDLTRRTASEKTLRDKAFNVAKNPKYDLGQEFINSLKKKLLVAVLKMRICQTSNQQKNYTNQLIENLIKEKYTHLSQTIFGVLIH